ncbi:hypothetical protein JOF48_003829 [Arthrobacter stackebrandtii]|uniref:ABC transporter permease n=1 Tax=Arthrobacter stackebrandtii TaxID=272161 RepID=A0ABS4Z1X3_9MICC|nr:DUF6297 family protein [Arthrobacter stackebrandtii]MBP2415030.1 hypothetical protein [Arthrobacter stackebrandtii]PYH00822.1 hypothetical protein CVV67_07610 [Arthrobacter stackebrandtii]
MALKINERFSAREIRQYTFRAGLSRTEGGIMELVSEVYTSILGALTLLTMAGALVVALRHSLGVGDVSALAASAVAPGFHSVTLLQASATVLLTLAASLLAVEMTMGPVAMTLPQTAWWLGLPVRRRGFIQPGFLKSLLWPSIAAVLVVLPLALGMAANPTPGNLALSVLCGLGLAWLLYGIAGWCQVTGSGAWLKKAMGAITLLAPLTLVATALYNNVAGTQAVTGAQTAWLEYLPTSWPLLVADGATWPLLLVALALGLLALVYLNLERITTAALKESAAAGAYAASSLLSMDATELSRSLGAGQSSSNSKVRLPMVFRRGTVLARSVKTLASTHATMALRSPATLLRVLVLAAIPASLASVEFLGNAILIAVAVYLCAYFAATSMGATARFANGNPAVDMLMPLPAKTVRQVHFIVPGVAMTLWAATCFGLLLALGVGSPALLLLAVLAGPGVGAATLRAGFRPAPDWNMPAVATASGPIPTGAIRAFLVGPDLTLIVLLPVLICLIAGGVPSIAFPFQLTLTWLALLWGTHIRKPKSATDGGLFGMPAPGTTGAAGK